MRLVKYHRMSQSPPGVKDMAPSAVQLSIVTHEFWPGSDVCKDTVPAHALALESVTRTESYPADARRKRYGPT